MRQNKNNNNFDLNRIYIFRISLCIIAVIIIPIIVNILFSILNLPATKDLSNPDWLSFFGDYIGSILGGIFTFIGIKITINYENEKRKAEFKKEKQEKNQKYYDEIKQKKYDMIAQSQPILFFSNNLKTFNNEENFSLRYDYQLNEDYHNLKEQNKEITFFIKNIGNGVASNILFHELNKIYCINTLSRDKLKEVDNYNDFYEGHADLLPEDVLKVTLNLSFNYDKERDEIKKHFNLLKLNVKYTDIYGNEIQCPIFLDFRKNKVYSYITETNYSNEFLMSLLKENNFDNEKERNLLVNKYREEYKKQTLNYTKTNKEDLIKIQDKIIEELQKNTIFKTEEIIEILKKAHSMGECIFNILD